VSFAGISALLPSALAGQVRGKPTAYFFGFTHCPEVCPTTLFEMTQRLKDLGQGADPLIGVGATWIVGEVEVEHDLAVMCRTQIRPLTVSRR
jgi:hypothetical protein